MDDARSWLDTRVRELVRSSGIDPQEDMSGLDRLIDVALAEYESLVITGSVIPLVNQQEEIRALRDDIGGFGPVQRLLDDPAVEEMWINEPGKIFVARAGRSELTNVVLSDQQVRDLVERMLRASGRRLDLSSPFVDAALRSGSGCMR